MPTEVILDLPKFHEKQKLVWTSKATEILFAGDTRAGKSFSIRKMYIRYCSEIPGLQTDIFRLNFDDVIKNHMEGETSFPVLLDKWEKEGLVKINATEIIFFNDSRISLEHCVDDRVMLKHRGIPKHVRTFEESAQILERRIRALTGWVTMSEEMLSRVPEKWKGLFPKIFHITNFLGPSMGYYRRGFIDCCPAYSLRKVGMHIRQYVPAHLDDNPSEDADATRARIKEAFKDEATQKALLECNPHSFVGEFFPEWDEERHVVKDFIPPHWWFRYRVFDWGISEPAYTAWIALSDGEPFIDSDGNKRWFPRGAIIVYQEWNLCKDSHPIPEDREPEKGAGWSNEDMARGILERSELEFKTAITLTDSKPFQSTGGEGPDATFKKHGCILTQADTSRVAGWSEFRSRLIGTNLFGDMMGKIPMIYICERCIYLRDYIPQLARHPSELKPEDAAEHGEATHSCDAIRYACMAHNNSVIKDFLEPMESRIKKEIEASKPTPNKLLKRAGMRPIVHTHTHR